LGAYFDLPQLGHKFSKFKLGIPLSIANFWQICLRLFESPDPHSRLQSMKQESLRFSQDMVEHPDNSEILTQLKAGQLLMVNARRRNGLIIYKRFYAEFAGPGAAVGSFFDLDCQRILPVGDLSLLGPDSQEERQKAYLIRRQWIRLTQQLTDNPHPVQRAQKILTQFDNYFGAEIVDQLPDEAFALMVGVLPQTIRSVRLNSNDPPIKHRA
jgi:hypothetical protein